MSTCDRLDLQTLGISTGSYAQKSPRSLTMHCSEQLLPLYVP